MNLKDLENIENYEKEVFFIIDNQIFIGYN